MNQISASSDYVLAGKGKGKGNRNNGYFSCRLPAVPSLTITALLYQNNTYGVPKALFIQSQWNAKKSGAAAVITNGMWHSLKINLIRHVRNPEKEKCQFTSFELISFSSCY